ncbi:hypothetical protein D3C86_1849560 [compost metagenome]
MGRLRKLQKKQEDHQIRHEKAVRDGDEALPGPVPYDVGKDRIDGEHRHKRAGEQPRQIAHAASDPKFIANGAQHIVGEEENEDVQARPCECLRLRCADIAHAL